RKTPSRLELRKQAEAVESKGGAEPKKKAPAKKATTTRAKRTKEKAIARKRLVWVVFNGSMKEEGRFPYDQRAAAEEKTDESKLRSAKKRDLTQPVKERLGDGKAAPALAAAAAVEHDDEPKAPRKAKVKAEAEDEEEAEDDDDDDDGDDE